jgi:tight adherence protein C
VVDAADHGGAVLTVGLPVAWAAVVLVLAWQHRPAPERVRTLAPAGPTVVRPALGPAARRWAAAAVGGALSLVVLPVAAPLVVPLAWGAPVLRARRRAGTAAVALQRALPETIDLLRLAVGAGCNVPLAAAAVGRRGAGPVAAELAWVADQVDGGRRCADALDDAAARLGPAARPLLAALAASDRYGASLDDTLARLAADARADRRRRAEEAARRVPVRLLFPLVLLVLPAFALLTVAPLVAGGLGSLRL